MDQEDRLAGLPGIWKRVEAARPALEGAAALMPRKKRRGFPLRPFPPYGRGETTSSASRG